MASGAASIDSWSDSEIRTKLAELGTPVGPVTETTRKILIKKLKRLLQLQSSNAGSPAKQRRSLVRYSSGEDSQGEEANMPPPTSKVKNLRRKTVGPDILSTAADNSLATEVSRSGISERTRGRKSLGNTLSQKDSFDTDSDSDISLTYSSSRLRKSRRSEVISGRSSPKIQETLQDTKRDSPTSWNSLKKSTDYASSAKRVPEPKKSVQEEEEEDEEQEDTEEEEEKAPVFQSAFLSRLSSAGKLPSSYRSSVSPKPERKTVTSPYSSQSFLTQRGIRSFDDKIYSTRHEIRNSYVSKPVNRDGYTSLLSPRQTTSYSNVTPKNRIKSFLINYKKWLLGGVAILILISVLYLLLLANFSTRIYLAAIDSDENKYPICGQEGVDSQICVRDEDLKRALDVSKVFIPRVLELTVKSYCDPPSDNASVEVPTISEEEALKYLGKKMPSISRPQLEKDLRNFKILVLSNPHWEVEVVSKGLTDVKAILFNGDFVASRVDLPMSCFLRLTAYKLMKIIIAIGILVGLGFLTMFGLRLYKRSQERHKQEVYALINKVLHMLCIHHEQNIVPGYISVDNCRDELIIPSEREKKKHVWNEAAEFLEKHESRVRTEVHSVRGENVKVWRWLPAGGPPVSPNTSMDSSSAPILGRLL